MSSRASRKVSACACAGTDVGEVPLENSGSDCDVGFAGGLRRKGSRNESVRGNMFPATAWSCRREQQGAREPPSLASEFVFAVARWRREWRPLLFRGHRRSKDQRSETMIGKGIRRETEASRGGGRWSATRHAVVTQWRFLFGHWRGRELRILWTFLHKSLQDALCGEGRVVRWMK